MLSNLFLNMNGVKEAATTTPKNTVVDYSAVTCDTFKVNVFERLITKTERVGYVDESAELITADHKYNTTTPFWIISDGIANLVKFNDMFISDKVKMTQDINTVLSRVAPLWQYSRRNIISNGSFYEYKWIYNKTKQILMVELTNGDVQYYKSTQQELFDSTNLDRYEDGLHYVDDPDIFMDINDELLIYREYGVLILIFTIIRQHRPLRPLEYVNAAFCPRPASICIFADDKVANTIAKK